MINKFRITIIFLLMSAVLVLPLAAQTAADTERLLEAQAVSWGEAARLVLAAAEQAGSSTPEEAFSSVAAMAKLPKNAAPGSEVSLGGLSLMIMKAFNLNGGLYRFFPNARYAYRELVYLNVIQGRSDPGMKVSGERLFRILGRTLDHAGPGDGGLELE